MRRGDVLLVDFSGGVGGEVQKTRPAVVVTNSFALQRENRVQVVPFTSNTRRVSPAEALVILRGRRSKAMANQLATVAHERIRATLGHLTPPDLRLVDRAVAVQLDLPLPSLLPHR